MREFADVAHLPWDPDQRAQNIRDFKNGEIWLICEDEKPFGYAVNVHGFSFEFGGRVAFIDEFYLRLEHRRKGVGRQTLDFLARNAAGQGFVTMILEASDSQNDLHAFYETCGFSRRDYRLYTRNLR